MFWFRLALYGFEVCFSGRFQAFEKHNVEKDVAEQIKKEFDKKHGPTWHCIVGRNFGKPVVYFSVFSSVVPVLFCCLWMGAARIRSRL